MACDCKSQVEESLLERFRGQELKATDHRVSLEGYALMLNGDAPIGKAKVKQKGAMDAKATARFPTKVGGTREKTKTITVVFTYCPFCGKPYDEPETETTTGAKAK